MCRVYPQVVRTTFNNRHTSKVNSQTTSDVIQLLVNRLLRHFTNRPLYMYAYIYHVSMFMFVGDTGATHNCFRHVHAKYTNYGQLCQFHVNLVRQPSPLFCSSLNLEYIVFFFAEYCCPDPPLNAFRACGGVTLGKAWLFTFFKMAANSHSGNNFFTFCSRNMYNFFFIQKLE